MYSAFVALAVAEVAPGGQIVAIVPRSFCNGPYYRPFRYFILERAAIRHLHLFESRREAFKDDDVLQENIIIRLECGGQQGSVTVSTSTDDTFNDLVTNEHPFERILFPDDPERFIHVPTSPEKSAIELSPAIRYTPADLGVKVSTGPVVDFRLKAHLRDMPGPGTVPLLYPGHFNGSGTAWPIEGTKKPNAIERNANTEKWLYPSGFYCVVRRFSSKEEKRRIMASVVQPGAFGDVPMLGFENHLNLFHENKCGLPERRAFRPVPAGPLEPYAGQGMGRGGKSTCRHHTHHGLGALAELFAGSSAGLVYVTAFPNRAVMGRYLHEIAWETEVWVADAPSHLIHFNGERFLGPYDAL